jgi:hypothetical protein
MVEQKGFEPLRKAQKTLGFSRRNVSQSGRFGTVCPTWGKVAEHRDRRAKVFPATPQNSTRRPDDYEVLSRAKMSRPVGIIFQYLRSTKPLGHKDSRYFR